MAPVDRNAADLFAAGFMAAPIALLLLSNRQILRCNEAAGALFGWPVAEMVGQSVRQLYPSHFDYETTGARWAKLLQDRVDYQDERFMQTRGGDIFWASARGRTLTPEAPFDLMVWSFDRLDAPRPPPANGLTPREREIAQHIVNGRSCKEIGKILGISHRTVEFHRGTLLRKLDAKNTADLVSKFIVVR